jgi:hypothetical protein
MPFKEKLWVDRKKCFDFSLFIGEGRKALLHGRIL